MQLLDATLKAESPRYTPRAVPPVSRLIAALVPIIFGVLLWQAFFRQGVAAWSVGIAYILYDTALLVFTALQIRDLRHTPPLPAAVGPAATFGVIVAAYNEAGVLAQAIDRLRSKREPPDIILIAGTLKHRWIAGHRVLERMFPGSSVGR